MNKDKYKLIRITTVPISMNIIMKGQLNFMQNYFEVIGVTSPDDKHSNEVRVREGIRVHAVPMARAINLIQDIKSLVALYCLFRKEKPEIVHTHTPKAGLLGMVAAYLAKVPVRLHTVGGMPLTEVTGYKRILLNWLEKLTYGCADTVYPNSKGLKDIIIAENLSGPEKLKVIANGGTNGINIDYFKPDLRPEAVDARAVARENLGIGPDELAFCFVGRIAREKGINELIDAFLALQAKYAVKLVLVGPFEEHYGVLDASRQVALKSNPNILQLGRFDDVRPYYALSDVFVFPSYREGFPNAVLEAGAMGLPSIVTNINGCNEIITHGLNGLIVAPKSAEQLKEAMELLINDKGLRMNLAERARPTITAQFKREFVWQELLKEYQEQLQYKLGIHNG